MRDIKLTRWATYLVPGSIVVFSFYLLLGNTGIKVTNVFNICNTSEYSWVVIFIFSLISYIVGIGLWGVCYSNLAQKTLFCDPHNRRVRYSKTFLREKWKREKYYRKLKKFFPDIPEKETRASRFEYRDFQFIVVSIYETSSEATKERLVSTRETIGLLQSLILSSAILNMVLIILVIIKLLWKDWQLAPLFFIAVFIGLCITSMLYVHYFKRNYYYVRDTLMAFLI